MVVERGPPGRYIVTGIHDDLSSQMKILSTGLTEKLRVRNTLSTILIFEILFFRSPPFDHLNGKFIPNRR